MTDTDTAEARRQIPAFVRADLHLMHIDGKRVPALSGETLPHTDPATGDDLARIPRGAAPTSTPPCAPHAARSPTRPGPGSAGTPGGASCTRSPT
nr:hypothetical protein GCM10025730_49670 [Promicromonospora thailandica]